MNKQIIKYEDVNGQIAKTINGVADGEVVNEGHEDGWNPFRWFASLFGSANPTRDTDNDAVIDVEGVKTYDIPDDPDYQYQVNFKPASDYQGPVYWDGNE